MNTSHPIMLIRHAEKPLRESRYAQDIAGAGGRHGLSSRGERRAQLLAAYFMSSEDLLRERGLCRPRFIFAAATTPRHRSTRPVDTVKPLAAALNLAVRDEFASDPPFDKAADTLCSAAAQGAVLVSWRQDTLPELARAIGARGVPDVWPESRFDMIWLLERSGGVWTLTQVPQMLLPEDSDAPIRDERG
ncbi:hypothetical protein CAL29_03570 [Bordetella genomosp. 10]|uniref:Histidine phosphatase family protein n=1 Tax=Bordetella genomosp. 10 TaxID=1416804 RepID=A0A261SJ87_9BORD|nr:hypothetical protein [Bordetella genomosp. 10]OZI37498.1 hypothetical protein CAL29_03570 [Bordetella genomosp. 10]